jgi:fibronectin type 3 domain-containing protein
MKLKITLALLIVAFAAKAQQYQVFSASADQKIQLKWMSKTINKNGSFDIFRKNDNDSWQKITDKPVTASPVIKVSELKTAKNPFPDDKAYEAYIQHRNKVETTPNKQAFADYTLALGAVFDNRLAFHLGIYFEDKTVSAGQKYQYRLVESASQKELSVSTPMAVGEIPAAPTELQSTQQKQNIVFTWKVNEEFVAYNLYRNGDKVNADAIFPNFDNQKASVSYADENIAPGSYKYTVRGITYVNTESKASAELAVAVKDLTPPTAVTGFKVARKGSEIQLSWTPSKDKEAKGYFVFRSDDKGKTYKKLTETMLAASANQFTDKLKEEATGNVQYYVETQDASGNKIPSVKTTVYVPDHSAPEMPKNVKGTTESGKISLSWTANTEKDLAGYRIYRGLRDDDENNMLLLNVTPQTATTFIDTFPKKAKTKFIYKVSAMDKAFNESPKAVSWLTLPDVVPPVAPVLNSAKMNGNDVELQWGMVVSDAIMGYDVYRVYGDKKEKLTQILAKENTFTDKTATQKGLYEYYVQAVDSAKLESKPSNKMYVNTSQDKEIQFVKLSLTQDAKTKKVVVELLGIIADEVQMARLFRKDGDTGFKVLPYQFSAQPTIDETSEPGNIYEYFVEVTDRGDRSTRSETVIFNNP